MKKFEIAAGSLVALAAVGGATAMMERPPLTKNETEAWQASRRVLDALEEEGLDSLAEGQELAMLELLDLYKDRVAREAEMDRFNADSYGPSDDVAREVIILTGQTPESIPMNTGDLIEALTISDGRTTLHHAKELEPADNVTIQDVVLTNNRYWASRAYRMRSNVRVQRLAVQGVLNEHGLYWNIAGYNGNISLDTPAVTIEDSLFENIGSQAIQFVQRPSEQGFDFAAKGDITPGGLITVRHCLLRNVGYNHTGTARAAYALSFFSSLNDVLIEDVVLDNSMQRFSKGALLCEARRSLELRGCHFVLGESDRSLAQIRDVDKVVIKDSYFESYGTQARLFIEDCGEIDISGCTGNIRIVVNKKDVGPINQGYSKIQ